MKTILKTLLCAVGTMLICLALLALVAYIPREAIQKQSENSAQYFAARQPFAFIWGEWINAVQDNYSDTVLCDIAYCVDEAHPFSSIISARYAQKEGEEAYQGYLTAVNKNTPEANREYGRYWHGSLVLIRPLLMVMHIGAIRIMCGVIICVLQLAIIILLIKRRKTAFAVCYLLAFLLIHPWMLFTSMEYETAFLTASVVSFVMMLKRGKKLSGLMPFFAVAGVVTCFVDFLTTETLTFTLPMLLALTDTSNDTNMASDSQVSAAGKSGISIKKTCLPVIGNGLCWLVGYLGMFAFKIALLAATAGKDTVSSSMDEGFLRLGGEVRNSNISIAPVVGIGQQLRGAIWHNLACLYPVKAGVMKPGGVWLATLLIFFAGVALVYLLHDRIDLQSLLPMSMLAALPLVRFLVLSNHSYIHFFITYRALMVTLTVFIFFVYDNGLKHIFSVFSRKK